MIGYLKGQILTKSIQTLILNVNSVGYELTCPSQIIQSTQADQELELFVYTHVREDQLKLYGFSLQEEKAIFMAIIEVSGVGPKIALSILSAGNVEQIRTAIIQADLNFFTTIKGLGKKNAQKIIIELKNKIGSTQELDLKQEEASFSEDVIMALQSFGFLKRDIIKVLKEIDTTLPESQQIKLALQTLGK
ncbi:Holliday junction branch migration protein RuvA [Candidatus Beckwithbacteria bacterium]|nr:Holliday junction branch migration protein RuvA [Candidatus Beckwithbacteria bacterium]